MTEYDLTVLTKAEGDKEAVKDTIAKVGGEVTDERPLGSRPLAYPIKKERAAYFTLLRFKMEPEKVLTLNRELLLSGNLLRHMITTAHARAPVTAGIVEPDRPGRPAPARAEMPTKEVAPEEVVEARSAAARKVKPVKKTKAQEKAETQAAKERQKKIEEELAKILKEE